MKVCNKLLCYRGFSSKTNLTVGVRKMTSFQSRTAIWSLVCLWKLSWKLSPSLQSSVFKHVVRTVKTVMTRGSSLWTFQVKGRKVWDKHKLPKPSSLSVCTAFVCAGFGILLHLSLPSSCGRNAKKSEIWSQCQRTCSLPRVSWLQKPQWETVISW